MVFTSPQQGEILREPTILIANHQMFADSPMILIGLCHNQISLLAADKLLKIPIVGPFLESIDAIPIQQNVPQTAWFKSASKRLRAGSSLLIYPEGHKNIDGEMTDFQPGFLMLAAATGVPILPIYITERYRPFAEPTQLFVGAPIALQHPEMNAQYLQQQTKQFQQIMLDLKAYADHYRKADDTAWKATSNPY